MPSSLTRLGAWLHARAENLLAAMLAVMFAVFIIQIVFRYLINLPIGWTQEISVIMWVWLVLFGTAFVVRDDEEIRFDLLYGDGQRAHAARHGGDLRARRRRPLRHLAAGGARLHRLHEGREDRLPQDPLRLALFDLRHLRRRR